MHKHSSAFDAALAKIQEVGAERPAFKEDVLEGFILLDLFRDVLGYEEDTSKSQQAQLSSGQRVTCCYPSSSHLSVIEIKSTQSERIIRMILSTLQSDELREGLSFCSRQRLVKIVIRISAMVSASILVCSLVCSASMFMVTSRY